MSRDGLTLKNAITGEESNISHKLQDINLKPPLEQEILADNRSTSKSSNHKQQQTQSTENDDSSLQQDFSVETISESIPDAEPQSTQAAKIGTYRGFGMLLSFDSLNKEFSLAMKGAMTHTIVLGDDSYGNITRINNAFDKIPGRLQSVEVQLQTLYAQMESARAELQKPFPLEQELAEKTDRLAELDARLNMDESGEPEAEHENEPSNETAATTKSEPVAISAKEKPSILETLKVNAEKSRLAYGDKSETDKKAEVSI